MPTFDNVINLSGSAVAISYENKFLGENFANYARTKKVTLKGHIDSRSSNTDSSGVKETLSSYSQILSSAHDQTNVDFRINGLFYGKGRVLSIDFSEKNNPVRMGSFTADIEIYESGNLYDELNSSSSLLPSKQYPNLQNTLEGHEMAHLESMSENFSFSRGGDETFDYSHSLDFKYISGKEGTDYIALAKSLAENILNNNREPDFPFTHFSGYYNDPGQTAANHKFNETYDLVDLSFNFSKDFTVLGGEGITYSYNDSRSLTRSAEGFIEVTENGQTKSKTTDFTQAESALNFATGSSYSRCNDMLVKHGLFDGSSAADILSTQYVSFGKTLNRQQNTIDYNITFSNNPRYSTSGIHEYTQTISENFSDGTLTVGENGTYRPYGNKSTSFNETTAIKSILNNSAGARIGTLVSNYLTNYSTNTSQALMDNLKRTSFTIDYPKYGQAISYSCDYSMNGKFLGISDSNTYGLHTVEVNTSDNSPQIMRKSFMVPGQGELVQFGYQTEVGTRSISVTAQKKRTSNYISNPPNLQTQLDYLYHVAVKEMLKIPSNYPYNIIKEIWISNSSWNFASENGQIGVELEASFTMVGYDTLGNAGNHIITKQSPGNYVSL